MYIGTPHTEIEETPLNAASRMFSGFALLVLVQIVAPPAVAQTLTKSYPISPLGSFRFATFTSDVDCAAGCTITHRIHSDNVDRFVVVTWLKADGNPLMDQVDNAYLSNFFAPRFFGGYLSATESQWKGITNVSKAMGTADFTGTGAGTEPCGVGYVCGPPNGPEYYYFPALFQAPGHAGAEPGRFRPQGPTSYDTITSALSGVLLKPDFTVAQDENGNDLRASVLTFTSAVEEINGAFRYVYTVSNATDTAIPVVWVDAGIDGHVAAHGLLRNEIQSAFAPDTQDGVATYGLNRGYASSVAFYAPAIPEADRVTMLGVGLLVVCAVRRRRQKAYPGR